MKRKKEIKCYLFFLKIKFFFLLWCPQPPQSIVWGKKKPSYGMTLLFVVQLLLKNFSECKQIGQIGRHELVVMIVVSTTPTFLHKYPSLPQKKNFFFCFSHFFFPRSDLSNRHLSLSLNPRTPIFIIREIGQYPTSP